MSFVPPPRTMFEPESIRTQQQAVEMNAERHAQTHLDPADRGRLGTRPQRLLGRLLSRLRGR